MLESSHMDDWITAALARTGLPLSRRVATAEEWRVHLEQLVRDHQAAGLPADQARRAALDAFGCPERVRRQLRRQQWVLDRRAALAEVRKLGWPLTLVSVLYIAIALALAVIGPASLGWSLIGATPMLLSPFVAMGLAVFVVVLIQSRLTRQRPRVEFSFSRRFLLWTGVTWGVFAGATVIPLLFLVSAHPLLTSLPWFDQIGAGTFWRFVALAFLDRAGFNILGTLASAMVFALVMTVYERSRCVELPGALPLRPEATHPQPLTQ